MSVKENVATFVMKLPKVILLCVIVYLISLNFKSAEENKGEDVKTETEVVPLDEVKKYFPACTGIEKVSEVRYDVKNNGDVIGKLIVTTPIADDLIGYSGNVPLFLAVSGEDVILRLTLLNHSESPGFIRQITRKNFFSSWDGKTLEEAAEMNVEAVSGATMTTDAVRGSVKKALNFYFERDGGGRHTDWLKLVRHALGGLVVLLALVSMFWGSRMKKWRLPLQVASILILGFWSGYFVSFELLFNWLLNGVPWGARVLLPVIAVLAIVCPLFLNKAYYCAYLCPFGAAQEVMGKIRKKKIVPKGIWKNIFKYTRVTYFMVIIALLLWGIPLELASLEPFSAFLLTAASSWVIALAVVFLILSIFFSRPWCNYFCPTGELLDILRKGDTKANPERWKKVFRECLALVIFLGVLYFILQ